jgi:putative aldouronate transport system substrate-binding protein
MKKTVVIVLSLLLVVTLFATASAAAAYPEYLNLNSQAPIIKDEFDGQIKLKLMIVQDSSGGKWDDMWISQFLKAKYNLDFEVESVLNTALADKKGVMFAAGDLPDLLWNTALSTQEIIRYGQEEGMLYALDTLISEELTPNIYNYMQRDDVKKACTTPDGHIYALPMIINSQDEGTYARLFVNVKKMKELGIEEMPRTLDAFVDMLYAFKALDPENNFPVGGSMDVVSNAYFFLNAFGYVNSNGYGRNPTLRNGEVVIPAYDTEVFKDYLALMNKFYTDGIINPNYFTMENTEAMAQLNNGQNILYGTPVYVTGLTSWDEWEAPYPLTSSVHETPVWHTPDFVRVGGCAVSATTEYPELCLRICDIFFAEDGREIWVGVPNDSEYSFGYYGAEIGPEGTEWWDTEKLDGLDLWSYLMAKRIGFMPSFGAIEDWPAYLAWYKIRGIDYEKRFDMNNPDQHYRWSVYNNLVPYASPCFPGTYYLSEEENYKLTDLRTVIHPYIEEQVAKFITGARPLDEIDAFAEELKGLGIEDLLAIYKAIYGP